MTKKVMTLLSGMVLAAALCAPAFAADAPAAAPAADAPAAPVVNPFTTAPPPAAVAPKPKKVIVVDLKEGDPMPDFTVEMLSGKSLTSKEVALKNKVVIVTFIQTACSACKGEIVTLNKLAKDNKGKVFVLPIAVDMRSGKDFLENYKNENAVGFDFGIDPKFAIPRMFNVSYTPASILIKDGVVAKIYRGYDENIRTELEKAFN